MTKIKDIIRHLEVMAPPAYQESYDNCGLLTGSADWDLKSVLITLDVTEAVIEEAKSQEANMIIAHHPLIFKGLKKLTGTHYVERCIIQALKHDLAIYALHTNLDSVAHGVNHKIGEVLGVKDMRILYPKKDALSKLTTFVPPENTKAVLQALHDAGAGVIGHYENCSFRVTGKGTFKPDNDATPHIGSKNTLEEVPEERLEVQFPSFLEKKILTSLKKSHPYEEVVYFLQKINNDNPYVGAGMYGQLPKPVPAKEFIHLIKERMKVPVVRHTDLVHSKINKIAWCGGSGSFLLSKAKSVGAELFISADFKYHDYFEAENEIIIADIGHYESEQFTKELIYTKLSENFSNIALHLSKVNTNPITYT